jgi:hypothetical protein
VGHPISSLDKVAAAMRQALDAGKTGADVARAVHETLAKQAGKQK